MNYLNNIKILIEKDIVLKKKHRMIEDNSTLTTYFEIVRLIVEAQGGKECAKYGNGLVKAWSEVLSSLYGKGYDYTNLSRMRKLYLTFEKQLSIKEMIKNPIIIKISKYVDDLSER